MRQTHKIPYNLFHTTFFDNLRVLYFFLFYEHFFPREQPKTLWIGCTAKDGQNGILSARFDAASGVLQDAKPVTQISSSSFLATSPNGKFLYALNDNLAENDKSVGGMSAFEIGENGDLKSTQFRHDGRRSVSSQHGHNWPMAFCSGLYWRRHRGFFAG